MTKRALCRRTFLRGLLGGSAVALALPRLDCMLDTNGTAYADGSALPVRFGIWFFGNGVRHEHWTPEAEGADWRPKAELAPLVDAGLKPYLSVVSGLSVKTPFYPHHSGMTAITSGAPMKVVGNVRDTIVSTVSQPSIDMVAAQHLGGKTPFRSLELGVCKFRGSDEGTTFQYLSMNGPNNPNPPEYAPDKLFERLFGVGQKDPRFALISAARASVLDAVRGQIGSLSGRVSARDKQRLDQHFESVRAIERRLSTEGQNACRAMAKPVPPKDDDTKEPIAEKNALMSDLLAVALACDLTRVFSYCFDTCGSATYFWQTQATDSMHQMCHKGRNDRVNDAVVFTMQQCTATLKRLMDSPEGGGSVLDNCSILVTTEHGEGDSHVQDDFPIVIAGKGGGRLRAGLHVRSATKENTSKALLTALRGAGLPLSAFGHAEARVTEGIGALEG